MIREPVDRVGEIQIAVRFECGVVGTVEALPFVIIDQRSFAAVLFETGDSAVAVLARDETPFAIDDEPVASRLLSVVGDTRIAGWLHEKADALARFPLHYGI